MISRRLIRRLKFIVGGSGEEKFDHPTQKPVASKGG
jgi:hypothetical protein